MQVYLLLYDAKKSFLIAVKNKKSYFFHDPKSKDGDGEIFPDGKDVNGGGLVALPGGRLSGADPVAWAITEFLEETQVALNPKFLTTSLDQQDRYVAVFALCSTELLQTTLGYVQENLAFGIEAARAVQAKTYGKDQYKALRAAFPRS